MEIYGSVKNTQIPTNLSETPKADAATLLKEGGTLQGELLAREGNQLLLKVADVFLRLEAQGQLQLAQQLHLAVKEVLPERISLEPLTSLTSQSSPSTASLPQVTLVFIPAKESIPMLDKLAMQAGDTLAATLVTDEKGMPALKINQVLLPVIPRVLSLEGQQVPARLTGEQQFLLLDNRIPIFQQLPGEKPSPGTVPAPVTTAPSEPLAFTKENLGILKKMKEDGQFILQASDKQIKTPPLLITTRDLSPAAVVAGSGGGVPFEKGLPQPFQVMQDFLLTPQGEPSREVAQSLLQGGQSNLLFSRLSMQEGLLFPESAPRGQGPLVEGFIQGERMLLTPEIRFREQNLPLFVKLSVADGQTVFQMDPQAGKANQIFLEQLQIQLGQVLEEDVFTPEIIKKMMENKLPVTQEGIRVVQQFLQQSPMDPRTSMEFLLNHNLVMGLYYQFSDNRDKFLMKGMKKNQGRQKKEDHYEFTILYESESLGDTVIELVWTEHLAIGFFCSREETAEIIEKTLVELEEKIPVKGLKITVEYNQEKVKKEPVKTEPAIPLSLLDIRI